MKFSYTEIWQDTVRMLRANAPLFLAVAGVFFFLPALLIAYFVPQPEGSNMATALAEMEAYMNANWHWVLLANIVNSMGAVAIYLLLFDPRGRTVGGALAGALPILPFYFILSLLTTISVIAGLALLILPGIYLLGRLMPSGAVMVADGHRNPISAMRGSWGLTKGKGWAVAGLVLLIFVTGWIATLALTSVFGSIFLLVGGREGLGGLLVLILNAAIGSVLSLLLVVLCAAIYRRLASPASAPAAAAAD